MWPPTADPRPLNSLHLSFGQGANIRFRFVLATAIIAYPFKLFTAVHRHYLNFCLSLLRSEKGWPGKYFLGYILYYACVCFQFLLLALSTECLIKGCSRSVRQPRQDIRIYNPVQPPFAGHRNQPINCFISAARPNAMQWCSSEKGSSTYLTF